MRKAAVVLIVPLMLSSFCTGCGAELPQAAQSRQATSAPKPASRFGKATAEAMAKFTAAKKHGWMLYKQKRHAEAAVEYEKALKLAMEIYGADHRTTALMLNNLAYQYAQTAQYAKAEPLYLRSLKIRETKLGKDHPDVAESLNNLASLYMSMGEYAKAEPLHLRSLSLKIRETKLGKDHPSVATSLHNLASLYKSMGEYAKAEPLYVRSLKIWETKLGKDHPSVGISLYNLANLYMMRGHHGEAWPLARRAMRILVGTRSRAAMSALARASYLSGIKYGDLPIVAALKANKRIDTLEVLEQQRALALRELLAQGKARAADVLAEADRKPVVAALGRINALNAAIGRRVRMGLSVETLREELRRAERRYDAFLAKLSGKYQQFVAAETAQAVTSKQMVESPALDGETAIVGWVSYEKWLWGYVIRTSGVKWIDLSNGFGRSAEKKVVGELRQAAWRRGSSGLSGADLHRLYRGRLQPLEEHLKGATKLVIVSHDWTAHLPVEMLLTDEPQKGQDDMAKWPWLSRKYRISYAPSVTTLDILCRERPKWKNKKWLHPLFALADPPFSDEQLAAMKAEKAQPPGRATAVADTSDVSASALTRAIRFDPTATPNRLPGTRREAGMIANVLGADRSQLLLGPDASERKLLEAAQAGRIGQCRYVHLATHGFVDTERPEFSGLVLARAPVDKDYDGVLHMREVFHLKLDADLVVLSACQTGLGKQLSGEGMLGLSTAFFFAGTPSLVMSLWNVSDDATALLMWRFYSNLKAGQPKAAALHEAKNWLRTVTHDDLTKLGRTNPAIANLTRTIGPTVKRPKGPKGKDAPTPAPVHPYAHPHYWAAFILTGDPE